ncbi:unnamed protein product [Auanema sp. JU1783]|nr:unnamed protein product [Auanema sp. JU1783]
MLRRYSSKDLDSLTLGQHKTIGSNSNCDIIIQSDGVAPTHAIIEFHSLTNSFWIKDLSLVSETKVNGIPVLGQVQLTTGDLLQFGMSQPLIFENNQIFSKSIDSRFNQSADTAILPVVGKQIVPQQSSARVLESRQRVRSNSKRFQYNREGASSRGSLDNYSNAHSPQNENASIEIVSSTRNASVGNNLLQRVIRLQAEIARKDEEILLLTKRLQEDDVTYSNMDFTSMNTRLEIPNNRQDENRCFELDMYRAFMKILATKLHSFNNRTLSHPTRDYSDVFSNIYRTLDDNFSSKMMEIAAECDSYLEKLGYNTLQRSRLKSLLEDQKKESISSLASELEVILPVIKDCSSISKDCIRACSVFTDWSREQGDLILNSPKIRSSMLNSSIKDLKDEFSKAQMSRHWLIPSLTPFLQLISLDLEKREKGVEKSVQTEVEGESRYPSSRNSQEISEEKTSDIDFLLNSAENLIKNLTRIVNKGVITKTENLDERIDNLIKLLKNCMKRITTKDILEGLRHMRRNESFPNMTSEDDDENDEMNDADSEFEEEEFALTDPSFHTFPYKERISTIYEENSDEMEHERKKSEVYNNTQPRISITSEIIDALDMGMKPKSPPALPPPPYDDGVMKDYSQPPPLASDSDSEEEKTAGVVIQGQDTDSTRLKRELSKDLKNTDSPSSKHILKSASARPKTTSNHRVRIMSFTEDEERTVPENLDDQSKTKRVRLVRPKSATVEKHRYRLEKQKRGISLSQSHPNFLGTIEEEHLDLDFLASKGFELTDEFLEKLRNSLKLEHAQCENGVQHTNCVLDMAKKLKKEKMNVKLFEARKEATQNLTNWFDHSDKPQNICEISHSAHIQSHINTSTTQPIVVQAIPVRSYVFSSPPKLRKKQKSMPMLVQPRMQF